MSTSATGPRSEAGKVRSSLNATKHGLRSERPVLPGEDAEEWDQFHSEAMKDFDPVTTLERELAERAVLQMWRLRRVARYEVEMATDDYNDATESVAATLTGLNPQNPEWQALLQAHRDHQAAQDELVVAEAVVATVERLPEHPDQTALDPRVTMLLLQLLGTTSIHPLPATLGALRQVITTEASLPLGEVLPQLASAAEESYQEAAEAVAERKRQVEWIALTIARQREKLIHDRQLLQKTALDRVVRYEAHVSRQLDKAVRLLNQFKAERRAREETARVAEPAQIPVPVRSAVDVDSTAACEPTPIPEVLARRTQLPPRAEASQSSFGNRERVAAVPTTPADRDEQFVRQIPLTHHNGVELSARKEESTG